MTIPISLLVAHFIGDFLFQNDWMALNKSKNNSALTVHVLVYSLTFLVLGFGWKFWLLTFYTHWFTDYVTSRITSKLWFIDFPNVAFWKSWDYNIYNGVVLYHGKRHWFFVAIGFDQLIHFATLAITFKLVG